MKSMTSAAALDRGRNLFARQAWTDAHAEFSAADSDSPLEPEDVERLAISGYLIGKDAESADLLARAHHEWVSRGACERAARCAFWLFFILRNKGQHARGSGWLARARRLLDEGPRDCVEQGYLLLPVALQAAAAGDVATAYSTFEQASKIGDRFREADLVALARQGQGPGADSVGRGRERRGPARRGDGRASRRASCHRSSSGIVVLQRDRRVLRNFRSAPGAGMDDRAHRVVRLATRPGALSRPLPGAARRAHATARRVVRRPGRSAAGVRTALRRRPVSRQSARRFTSAANCTGCAASLRKAEEAYRQASDFGRKPQPGLAQLRLAQGQVDAARAAICRVVDEAQRSANARASAGGVRRDSPRGARRQGGAGQRR